MDKSNFRLKARAQFILAALMIAPFLWGYIQGVRSQPSEEAFRLYTEGFQFSQEERLSAALNSYNAALALAPRYCGLYNARAWVYYKLSRYDEALKDVTFSLSLRDTPEAYRMLGWIHLATKKSSLVLADVKKARSLGKTPADDVFINQILGVYYKNLGDNSKAERYFTLAIDFFLKNRTQKRQLAYSYYHRATIYENGKRYLEALRDYGEAAYYNPRDPWPSFNRVFMLIELKRYKDAIAELDKLIKTDPKNKRRYLYRRFTANYRANNRKAADADMKRYLSIRPLDAWQLGCRGYFALYDKKYAEARRDFSAAVKIDTAMQKDVDRWLRGYAKAIHVKTFVWPKNTSGPVH